LAKDLAEPYQAEQERYIAFQAIASSLNGVILTDAEGRIMYANPAFVAMFEYDSADAVLGRSAGEMFADAKLASLVDVEQQTPDSAWEPEEFLSRHKDGSEFPVAVTCTTISDDEGRTLARMASFVDITKQKQAETELRASEQRYRELVENVNSIIMRITPDHRITFVNEYAQNFFGYSAGEIVGRSVIGTIVPEIDSAGSDLRKMTQEITAHPEIHGAGENENMCKDGRRVWVHWSIRAIRDELGQPKEFLCAGADMTQRKRLETEAQLYRRRLRALADRLTATEEQERRRVATQLHDTVIQTLSLSNIRLGGVLAAVEKAGLSDQRDRVDGVRELLDKGITECRNLMADLVPSMLYEVGLAAAIRDFADKQSKLDGTPISVAGDDHPQPMNDALRGLLFQCARELIMNALKHAGACEILVSLSSADDHIQLQVRDTGRGFNLANLNETQHDAAEGGFGLFSIRERLDGLGGQLDIDAAPGKGTTATVRVPVRG
jgi:PAS domain S-box-containing protein